MNEGNTDLMIYKSIGNDYKKYLKTAPTFCRN